MKVGSVGTCVCMNMHLKAMMYACMQTGKNVLLNNGMSVMVTVIKD